MVHKWWYRLSVLTVLRMMITSTKGHIMLELPIPKPQIREPNPQIVELLQYALNNWIMPGGICQQVTYAVAMLNDKTDLHKFAYLTLCSDINRAIAPHNWYSGWVRGLVGSWDSEVYDAAAVLDGRRRWVQQLIGEYGGNNGN